MMKLTLLFKLYWNLRLKYAAFKFTVSDNAMDEIQQLLKQHV